MAVVFVKTSGAAFSDLVAAAREKHFSATKGKELDQWGVRQLAALRQAMKLRQADAALSSEIEGFAVPSSKFDGKTVTHTYSPRKQKLFELASPSLQRMLADYDAEALLLPRDSLSSLEGEVERSIRNVEARATDLMRDRGTSATEIARWVKAKDGIDRWRAGGMDPVNAAFSFSDGLEHMMAIGAFLTTLLYFVREAKARSLDVLLIRLVSNRFSLYDFESLKKVVTSRDDAAARKAVESAVTRELEVARKSADAEIDAMAAESVLVGAAAVKDKVELYDEEAALGDYLVPLLGWRLEMAPGADIGQHVELADPGIDALQAALAEISKGKLDERALNSTDAPPGGREAVRGALLAFSRNKAMKRELAAIQDLAKRARREDGKIVVAFLA